MNIEGMNKLMHFLVTLKILNIFLLYPFFYNLLYLIIEFLFLVIYLYYTFLHIDKHNHNTLLKYVLNILLMNYFLNLKFVIKQLNNFQTARMSIMRLPSAVRKVLLYCRFT